jgi:hypothetical protein
MILTGGLCRIWASCGDGDDGHGSGDGDDGHGKRAWARVAGRSKQWINRSKSVEMKRAAPAALSREHASPLRAAGRRSIVRSSTCRTWVPASRWKVPSEFPIHSILCFTTHRPQLPHDLAERYVRLVLRSPKRFFRLCQRTLGGQPCTKHAAGRAAN